MITFEFSTVLNNIMKRAFDLGNFCLNVSKFQIGNLMSFVYKMEY